MESRGIWWNIHDIPNYKIIFYSLFLISLSIFVYGFYLKIKKWTSGKPYNNFQDTKLGIKRMFLSAFFHKGWGKEKMPIVAHILVFYGFFILWIGTDILTVQERMPEYFFEGMFYKSYSFAMDLAGLLMLLGVFYFTYLRYIKNPKRLDNNQKDWIQLLYLIFFVIIGFFIEGIRQAATNQMEPYAFIGFVIAVSVKDISLEILKTVHAFLWWFHSLQTFVFISIIPFTKFSHIFTAPINLFFTGMNQKGVLTTPFNLSEILSMEDPPDDFVQTINKIEDFSWKDLMDLDACTACGKCQQVCPATNTEKPLSPKWVVLDLKQMLYKKPVFEHEFKVKGSSDSKKNITDVISKETLWSCTTCNACVESCPVGINQLSKIVDLRRTLIAENKAPSNLLNTLKNIRSRSNPWGQSPEDRERWTENLDVSKVSNLQDFEYLYWVGCAGAYDSRNQNIAKTMVSLLKKANIKFAILGKKEKCTGDIARRAGDEGLFQELAIENIEIFKTNNVKKIITHCPHCFNTFKNEYPQFGLKDVVVFHHTEILWELIKNGQLSMSKEVKEQITYHDSCYLGRHNNQYDAPRNILNKIPGVTYIEMKNSREKGTCCGGGGSQLWFEAPGKQINVMRLNEIKDSNASIAASACPFCTIMLETAKTLDRSENTVNVQDLSEIVARSVL